MNVGLQTSPVNYSLSKTDTVALKGIAILAMLFHHIYTCPPAGVEPYDGILLFLGALGKVCVSMFLFCSAYGLSVQYAGTETIEDSIKFVVKRLIRFYVNYWFVFLIFVPIGVFIFGRTLADAGNIYMIHTFIYYYWFSKYVYMCDLRTVGGFLLVLVICLLLSVLIELIKEKTGIYKLADNMTKIAEKY